MKKRGLIFSSIGLLILLATIYVVWNSSNSNSHTEEIVAAPEEENNTYKVLATAMNIPRDKTWRVKLGEDITKSHITDKSIYILDSKRKKIKVFLDLTEGYLEITPPKGNYNDGELYTLYIENDGLSKESNSEQKPIKMDFIIEKEYKNTVEYKKIIEVPKDKINEFKEDEVTLAKGNKYKKGDIILLPLKNNVEKEAAYKIRSVETSGAETKMELEKPKFDEIVSNMEVYQPLELKAGDFISNNPKYIKFNDSIALNSHNLVASTSPVKVGQFDIDLEKSQLIKRNISNNSIHIEIDELPLSPGLVLDGTVTLRDIEGLNDLIIKDGTIKRGNISLSFTMEKDLRLKKINWNQELADDINGVLPDNWNKAEVTLGSASVDLLSRGIGSISIFIERENTRTTSVEISGTEHVSLGLVNKGPLLIPTYSHHDENQNVQIHDTGRNKVKLGFGLNVGPSLYDVLFIGGVFNFGAFFEGGRVIESSHPYLGNIACNYANGGFYVEAKFEANLLSQLSYPIGNVPPYEAPWYAPFDTCYKFKKLSVEPYPIELSNGDTQEIKVLLHYIDTKELKSEIRELENKEFTIHSLNESDFTINGKNLVVSKDPKNNVGEFIVRYQWLKTDPYGLRFTDEERGISRTFSIQIKDNSNEMTYDDIFKSSFSESNEATFFNSITFSPVKKLNPEISLPKTISTLMDTYNGSFLFKAEPSNLYLYDHNSKKHYMIDEGINLAKFDRSNGSIYYTKTYSPDENVYHQKMYRHDSSTKDLTIRNVEMYQIDDFIATSLSVDQDVAMVSGYEYQGEQPINERNYYSVFIPNFFKEDIFRKNTFKLENTNTQPYFVLDKDIYVASMNASKSSYDIYSFSTTAAKDFKLDFSRKLNNLDKNFLLKASKVTASSKHVAIYYKNKFMVDGNMFENTQPIKQLEFLGDEYILILGESMELNLYSIPKKEFILLQNDVFGFSVEGNELYIETIMNETLSTSFRFK